MTRVTRRGFIKGLAATLGVAAVAPEVAAEEVRKFTIQLDRTHLRPGFSLGEAYGSIDVDVTAANINLEALGMMTGQAPWSDRTGWARRSLTTDPTPARIVMQQEAEYAGWTHSEDGDLYLGDFDDSGLIYPVEPSVLEPSGVARGYIDFEPVYSPGQPAGQVLFSSAEGVSAGDLVTLGSDDRWRKATPDGPIGIFGFYDGRGRVLTDGSLRVLTNGGKEQD